MSASPGGSRGDGVNRLSQYVCWEQNLPTHVCFVEEEEGAQRFQAGWRGVDNSAQRWAAAATPESTEDAAGSAKSTVTNHGYSLHGFDSRKGQSPLFQPTTLPVLLLPLATSLDHRRRRHRLPLQGDKQRVSVGLQTANRSLAKLRPQRAALTLQPNPQKRIQHYTRRTSF